MPTRACGTAEGVLDVHLTYSRSAGHAGAAPLARRLAQFGVTGWLGLAVIAFWAGAAIFGPALLSQRGDAGGGEVFAPISAAHWFGTDYLGRDMLARVIEGARYTVGVAFVATLLASGTGTLLALLAAASGRWIDGTLEPRARHADCDPEQDVRAGDGGRLRLVDPGADRSPRRSSTCPAPTASPARWRSTSTRSTT